MKKTFYIIGGTAVGLLVVGVILFILAGWGSLVEYHAFEWRGRWFCRWCKPTRAGDCPPGSSMHSYRSHSQHCCHSF